MSVMKYGSVIVAKSPLSLAAAAAVVVDAIAAAAAAVDDELQLQAELAADDRLNQYVHVKPAAELVVRQYVVNYLCFQMLYYELHHV